MTDARTDVSSRKPTRVALITGGSAGIGLATAHRLSSTHDAIALVGRDETRLGAAQAALAEHLGDRVLAIRADLGTRGEGRRIVRDTVDRFGRVDTLVNNAGVAPLVPLGETSVDTIDTCLTVNTVAPAESILEAWPIMVANGGGVIVNVSSVATRDPFPGFFAYAASKAAVNLMAHSIANEGRDANIRGFAVAPGAVETALLRSLFSTEDLPASGTLTPDEVAAVIAQCVEGERDDENGQVIWVPNG